MTLATLLGAGQFGWCRGAGRRGAAAGPDGARPAGLTAPGRGDSSASQLVDRRWIYEYDAWAEAVALT